LLARWGKSGLSLAVTAAALLLICFYFPGNLFGRDRPRVYPARGQIFFDDKPLVDANVVLAPVWTDEPDFPRPHAIAGPEGAFALSTFGKDDGAPAGEFRVLVTWFKKTEQVLTEGSPLPKNLLPARYGRFATSGLTVHVNSGENQPFALRLTQ
jgi:hypothetical protein